MKKNRKGFTPKQRKEIIARLVLKYGLRCWYCGISLEKVELNIDHIQAFSQNGSNDIDNLALACRFCNSHKFIYSAEGFLKYLARIRTGNFCCPILEQMGTKIEPEIRDILQKSFY